MKSSPQAGCRLHRSGNRASRRLGSRGSPARSCPSKFLPRTQAGSPCSRQAMQSQVYKQPEHDRWLLATDHLGHKDLQNRITLHPEAGWHFSLWLSAGALGSRVQPAHCSLLPLVWKLEKVPPPEKVPNGFLCPRPATTLRCIFRCCCWRPPPPCPNTSFFCKKARWFQTFHGQWGTLRLYSWSSVRQAKVLASKASRIHLWGTKNAMSKRKQNTRPTKDNTWIILPLGRWPTSS